MPGVVQFAAVAAGIVVCAFVGTQLAALRGLHDRTVEHHATGNLPSQLIGRTPQAMPDAPSGRQSLHQPAAHEVGTSGRENDSETDEAFLGDTVEEGTSDEPKRKKRVALAFYGLTRSLHYTIDSIRENIFEPLREAGYEYDIFLHTYNLERLEGVRSRESVKLNTTEWKLLQPDYIEVSSQEDFLNEYRLPIEACKSFHVDNAKSASAVDFYGDGFASVSNLLCQLNSISQVTSMWRATRHEYDAVLYLRPDMLYNCPLPMEHLNNMENNKIYIADFHHWRGYNDRFVMGTPRVAGAWGERLDFALSSCMRSQLHAERLVQQLIEHYHFDLELIDFSFFRVRATGIIAPQDLYGKTKRQHIPRCDAEALVPFQRRYERQKAEKRAQDRAAAAAAAAEEAARARADAEAEEGDDDGGDDEEDGEGDAAVADVATGAAGAGVRRQRAAAKRKLRGAR